METPPSTLNPVLINAEITDMLSSLAQLLGAGKENPYKAEAYQRAAAKVRTLSENIKELVHNDADLTQSKRLFFRNQFQPGSVGSLGR